METKLHLKGEWLILNDWRKTDEGSMDEDTNHIRTLKNDIITNGNFVINCVLLARAPSYWRPSFMGKKLYELNDLYFQFYPSPKPYIDTLTGKYYSILSQPLFKYSDLQEAKDHLDKFINKINSLMIFC